MSGYVYILRQGQTNFYKIGFTKRKDPMKRVAELQTGNAQKLSLRALIETDVPQKLEAHLHAKFKAPIRGRQSHKQGEWYQLEERWLNTLVFELRTREADEQRVKEIYENPTTMA